MAQAARWMRLHIAGDSLAAASAGLAAQQPAGASPILLWLAAASERAFALIAPLRLAPGRARRWAAWGAMPAVAACRELGVAAYLEGGSIWLHGVRVARVTASTVGACAVIEASFPAGLAGEPGLEAVFRQRIEAQHGWQFDTAWTAHPAAQR
jgi:hypothetical protein